MAKRSVPNLAQRVHPPEDNKMNKNDLKRILNKLTAAANPEEFEGVAPNQTVLEKDPCKLHSQKNATIELILKSRSVRSQQIPIDAESNAAIRELFSEEIYEIVKDFITSYCLCRKYRIQNGTNVSPLELNNPWSEIKLQLVAEPPEILRPDLQHLVDNGIVMKLSKELLEKLLEFMTLEIWNNDTNSFNKFCDDGRMIQPSDVNRCKAYLGRAHHKKLDFLYDQLSSIAVSPDVVTPCVTVPVEQIETAFSNIPSIVTMGLVTAGVAGFAFWIRKGNFTKAMAAAYAIAVASGASAAETQALNNALRGIAGPVMQQAANGQTFCPEPGTAGTSSGG